jgi:pyruvate carboxylase
MVSDVAARIGLHPTRLTITDDGNLLPRPLLPPLAPPQPKRKDPRLALVAPSKAHSEQYLDVKHGATMLDEPAPEQPGAQRTWTRPFVFQDTLPPGKIFIPNRNECTREYCEAVHALRHQHKVKLETVAVTSPTDMLSFTDHWKAADSFVILGEGARDAYQTPELIIAAAKKQGCVAIAPGYGFLAENPDFAHKCKEAGLIFLGPPPSELQRFGSKIDTRLLAKTAGVNVAEGIDHYTFVCESKDASPSEQVAKQAQDEAALIEETIAFVKKHRVCMVKAAFGGGGKGIRKIDIGNLPADAKNRDALIRERVTTAIQEARGEAQRICQDPNGQVFVEKFIAKGRHIEVQVAVGRDGKAVHLGTRNCSLQEPETHQKVVEIAGIVPRELQERLGAQAVAMMERTRQDGEGFVGLATVEFMVTDDGETLLEVNPRLQVEHPTTEELLDINIKWLQFQLNQAKSLEQLGITKELVKDRLDKAGKKVSLEVRVNAIGTGVIAKVQIPPDKEGSVRWAGRGFSAGRTLTTDFDKNILKLIVTADSLDQACKKAQKQLALFSEGYLGPETNVPGLINLLGQTQAVREATTTTLQEQPALLALNTEQRREALERTRVLNTLNYFSWVLGNQDLKEGQKSTHPGAIGPMPVRKQPQPVMPRDHKLLDTPPPQGLMQQLYQSHGLQSDRSRSNPEKLVQALLSSPRVILTDTTRRDAHQSLLSTRAGDQELLLSLPEETRILGHAVGSYEVTGGATFDASRRYLGQDQYERVRNIRAKCPNALLQMLIRGRNFLGYGPQDPEVARRAIRLFKEAGVDLFRTFNCQNDVDDLIESTKMIREAGGVAEACLCYSGDLSDAKETQFTLDYYLGIAKKLMTSEFPPHILAIKDMSGQLKPEAATLLISALRKAYPQVPIHLHMHNTGGYGVQTLVAATAAGVHMVDTAIPPLADGTSQPSMVDFVEALRKHPDSKVAARAPQIDLDAVRKWISPYWQRVFDMHKPHQEAASGLQGERLKFHQAPGGQISNLASQVRANVGDVKLQDVAAVYEIADRLMFAGEGARRFYRGIKVTPSSKAVGDFAITLMNKRNALADSKSQSKLVAAYDQLVEQLSHPGRKFFDADAFWENAFVQYIQHELPPAEFPAAAVELLGGGMGNGPHGFNPALARVVAARPGDVNKDPPHYDFEASDEAHLKKYGMILTPEEHIMKAIFPEVFTAAFTGPSLNHVATPIIYQGPKMTAGKSDKFRVRIGDKVRTLQLIGRVEDPNNPAMPMARWNVDGEAYIFRGEPITGLPPVSDLGDVGMPMAQAKVLRLRELGDIVQKGEEVAGVEAMKMEVGLRAPFKGRIIAVNAKKGDIVTKGAIVRLQKL